MFHPAEHPLERGWVGRIDGEHVTQLAAQTLQSFFTGGGRAREHAVYPLAGVRLLAPVLHPPSVRVFEDQETFAFANPAAIVGPGAVVTQSPALVCPRVVGVVGAERGDRGLDAARRVAPTRPGAAEGSGLRARARAGRRHGGGARSTRSRGVRSRRRRRADARRARARLESPRATSPRPGRASAPAICSRGRARGSVEVEAGARVEIEASEIGVLDQRTAS